MYCQDITINTPIAQGDTIEVLYKPQAAAQWLQLLPMPTTNTFNICGLELGIYEYKITIVKKDLKKCKYATGVFIINDGNNFIWQISYTNNISTQNVELLINNVAVYNSNYSNDPLTGTLPQQLFNANVKLLADGKVITTAKCNGIEVNPMSTLAEWNNINGNCMVELITATNGVNSTMVTTASNDQVICNDTVYSGSVYFTGTLQIGTVLYLDYNLTITLNNVGGAVRDLSTNYVYNIDTITGQIISISNFIC